MQNMIRFGGSVVLLSAVSLSMAAPVGENTDWFSSGSFTHSISWLNIGVNNIEAFVIEIVSDASGQGFSQPAGQVNSGAWTFNGASSSYALFTGAGDFGNQWSFAGPDTAGVPDFDLIYRIHFFNSTGVNNFTFEWNNTSSASGTELSFGFSGTTVRNIGAQGLDLNQVTMAVVPLPPAAWGGLAMLGVLGISRRFRK
jgi:hypothetical protein